jgi:hypothetical protein
MIGISPSISRRITAIAAESSELIRVDKARKTSENASSPSGKSWDPNPLVIHWL